MLFHIPKISYILYLIFKQGNLRKQNIKHTKYTINVLKAITNVPFKFVVTLSVYLKSLKVDFSCSE